MKYYTFYYIIFQVGVIMILFMGLGVDEIMNVRYVIQFMMCQSFRL